MSSTTTEPAHPVVVCVQRLHELLDEANGVGAWSMSSDERREAVVALGRANARVTELTLRMLAEADRDDVAAVTAASSTAAWLAAETRTDHAEAHRQVRLARRLEHLVVLRDALAGGDLSARQAEVIAQAVDDLPPEAEPWVREQSEKRLVAEAAHHDAATLRILGRRIFDVVDPEAADHAEGRRLEAEERAAARRTYLQVRDNADGTHAVRGIIPTLHAAMLTKALHAFTSPSHRRTRPQPPGRTTRPEVLGQAFCHLLERLPAGRLPRLAGGSATVLVLLDYDQLLSGLGAVKLDTSHRISAGEARRLVCTSGVIPIVYRRLVDGRSVVLDAGRRRRLHSESQRIALTVADQQCTADGCTRPAAWCDTHHDQRRWADGGGTSVTEGRLLCPHHHRAAHSAVYVMEHLPNGQVRFHRRT